ncbi:MAG: S46 family peptidase, partial [Bacteroidales bacterium]|nr:S46 family peptidase [Bacteroidales bacterium]
RVYAGADNQPAEYSPENKPLQPKRSLQISLKGTKDGDYAMIMGYPGRTQRFQTAAQLKKMLTINDIRIDARTVRQGVIWDARMADPVINLKYASKYASSSNGWKKWQGMRQAFAKLGIIERQQQEEEAFASWAKAKKKRQAKYGDAISQLEDCCGATIEAEKAMTLLLETVYSIELVQLSRTPSEAAYSNYDPEVDRRVAKAVVEHYKKNVNPRDEIQLPDIDELFEKSVFTSLEKYNKAVADSIDLDADPARILRKSIVEKGQELSKTVATRSEQQQKAAKAFTAGMLEMNAGKPSYPDANFTMRLTYGHVLPYDPIDGVTYKSATTLTGVMEKWDPDNYEFRVPEKLRTIYAQKDFGGYANADGTMPACFLTNCDITGGNSGSPVLNADGQLIGLAFDGNWEAMSSDVMFEPNLQRCICVDIRYVLLILDKFGGAGYLLDEMDIVR